MLQVLLTGWVFTLLRASLSQAQVPIQADFDATQVGLRHPQAGHIPSSSWMTTLICYSIQAPGACVIPREARGREMPTCSSPSSAQIGGTEEKGRAPPIHPISCR